MAKQINANMFTPANVEAFWEFVKPGKSMDCWPWPGTITHKPKSARYPKGRKFGLFRRPGCGYVMNQRFAYICHRDVPASEYDKVRVRPTEDCRLGSELCCNPAHIERIDSQGDPSIKLGGRVARQFLVYWRPEQIQAAITAGLLDHAASEQFDRLAAGDILWVTGKTQTETLVTVGPLHVTEIVDQKGAERRLWYRPWKASYHAFSSPGDETVTRETSLGPCLQDLQFVSVSSPRLDLARPIGQQLQTMRQLTDGSAKRIEQLWRAATADAFSEFDQIQKSLESFADLDRHQIVCVRREQSFLRKYLFRDANTGTCALCGGQFPVYLLIAAHIKPRAECSDAERRDYANNIVPMCLLGGDALFERGLLIVEDGIIHIRQGNKTGDRLGRLLKHLDGRRTPVWKLGRAKYFSWHASRVSNASN